MKSIEKTMNQAWRHRQAGNREMAESCCRQILQIDPQHDGALLMLGRLKHEAGESIEAIASLKQAINLDATNAEFHYALATVQASIEHFAEARAGFEEAIRLKQDFAEAHNNLGRVLTVMGCQDEAIASFQQAMRLRPDIAQIHRNLEAAIAARRQQSDFDNVRPENVSRVASLETTGPNHESAVRHLEWRVARWAIKL